MSILLLLLLVTGSATSPPSSPVAPPGDALSQSNRDQAQALALIGQNEVHLSRLSEAQSNCDAALKLDPSNPIAKECLDHVAPMLVEEDLNNAAAKLFVGDKTGAIALASRWVHALGARTDQQERAKEIISKAQSITVRDILAILVPAWVRQILDTIAIFAVLALLLVGTRKFWRKCQRFSWSHSHGKMNHGKINWSMLPLKELPSPTDMQTGIPTDAVLDALGRVGHELNRKLWQPKLLLLRPTPPANFEPAIISEFLSDSLAYIVVAPGAGDLCQEWTLHQIQLSQAVQTLQLKMAAGIDVGSIARFFGSLVEWLNSDTPTVSGIAETDPNVFSLHLVARGGPIKSVAVTTSTTVAPGIDPIQLSAERAAVKFLLRMKHPEMTNDEVHGFAALRQGACLFGQYSGTVPGTGKNASTRTSSLANAALNLGFFRASIPLHCSLPCASSDSESITVTDENRQAALLAEGVAHSLVGEDGHRIFAIDCFRQLQDWPGSPETVALRQQAAYNEAILWDQTGNYKRSVLMLTDLLGERAPDTMAPGSDASTAILYQKAPLPDAIRFPTRLARLSSFARYSRDDWSTLPRSRVTLLNDDAEKLVEELDVVCGRSDVSEHDRRMAEYMYSEALRAIGHVELIRAITGPAASLYRDNRPIGVKGESLTDEGTAQIQRSIRWMLICEQRAPSADLYCDLAEAYLLLRDFAAAEGYARHATLQSNSDCERAYYIAAESFFLENTEISKALARKYAMDFRAKGTVTLDEFKSVCADLDIGEVPTASVALKPPP
jgi:hypothetical protein